MPCVQEIEVAAATLSSIVVAVFTVALFILQGWQHHHSRRVARANYALALFEKRLATFLAIREAMKDYIAEGRPTVEAAQTIREEWAHAKFLFPKSTVAYVEDILDKTKQHARRRAVWEPLRARAFAGEELPEQESRTLRESLDAMHEIEDWFLQQVEGDRYESEFAQYLGLPATI